MKNVEHFLKLLWISQDRYIQVIEERYCTTAAELSAYFNEQISHGLEGLGRQAARCPYQPGKRNFNWIKLKRHEEGQLARYYRCGYLRLLCWQGKTGFIWHRSILGRYL